LIRAEKFHVTPWCDTLSVTALSILEVFYPKVKIIRIYIFPKKNQGEEREKIKYSTQLPAS
jgi:hypothetical protein